MNQRYIISLGGSLIVPEEIDVKFLKNLRGLLDKQTRAGSEFLIAPGGGKIARKYSYAAKELGDNFDVDLDWLGIFAIRLNRLLLSFAFKDNKKIAVIDAQDAKPGWSSDVHAVNVAKQTKMKVIVNLSNIDYVYDKNPNKHKDAKPIKNISWTDFRKIVGNKWEASQNWPFDPVASKMAQEMKLKVIFLNGKNLKNFENFLNGKKFTGTVIE